jgi:hypothetical protein
VNSVLQTFIPVFVHSVIADKLISLFHLSCPFCAELLWQQLQLQISLFLLSYCMLNSAGGSDNVYNIEQHKNPLLAKVIN